jgi:hypothetical protein
MTFQDELVARTIAEWVRFGRDEGESAKTVTVGNADVPKEAALPFSDRIADYWLSIPSSQYDRLVKEFAPQKGRLDGTVRDLPWSAAFISFLMQSAGAGETFPYSAAHATWIVRGIRNRRANRLTAPLVCFRPGERPVLPGDLVGFFSDRGVDYDNAPEVLAARKSFRSHTDIVTEVDLAAGTAFAVGGNVGNSVSRVRVALDGAGRIAGGRWAFHIRNGIVAGQTVKAPAAQPEAVVG